MPKSSIQIQVGLSLPKFLEGYGSDQQCRDAKFKLRWSEGFVCPECGNETYCEIKGRKVYQCNHSHMQTALTSGTIFASTKLPLTKWFLAIYFLTQCIQLRTVMGFRSIEIERYAKTNLTSGCRVVSDGLACFTTVGKVDCSQMSIVSAGGRKGVEHPSFRWANTILGNVKNAITGTLHSVSLKHVPRYLAEFEFRLKRRNHLT